MSSTIFDGIQNDFVTIAPDVSRYHDNAGSVTPHDDDNLTSSESIVFYPIVKQPLVMIVVYSVAYGVIFLLGVVGNTLVVAVIARNSTMHSVTYFFIANLAVADILVGVFCLPITLISNLLSGTIHNRHHHHHNHHVLYRMCQLHPVVQCDMCALSMDFRNYFCMTQLSHFNLEWAH